MDKRSLLAAWAAMAALPACSSLGGSPHDRRDGVIDEAELRARLKALHQQMLALAPYVAGVREDGAIVATEYVRLEVQGFCPPPGPLPTRTALTGEEAQMLARAGLHATPGWEKGKPPAIVARLTQGLCR